MTFTKNNIIRPRVIRLEASTVCQLKCPSCPNALGDIAEHLGSGFLKFGDFRNIIDRNPWLSRIELSNWGEVFLNRELTAMLHYAHRKNVEVSASNGSNFNTVPEDVLEALVKYQVRSIKCSIDGASPETYSLYRVNGDFERVMENIRKLNKFKVLYQSPYPVLKWQFVAFGHNEHEIRAARRMAADLNMEFRLKLSWDDLYGRPFSPVKDAELVRREAGVGAASRYEYRTKYGREYALRACCSSIWKTPQINYDGRVLGCPVNYWGDYGNAFQDGLLESLNNDRINYAREMLLGVREAKEGIPCAMCQSYRRMKENQSWLTPEEILDRPARPRAAGMRQASWITGKPFHQLPRIWGRVKRRLAGSRQTNARPPLTSRIHFMSLPLQPDEIKGWKPYAIFRGPTKSLSDLDCHVSVLNPDHVPHLPHSHKEEELLLLLRGEVDLLFPDTRSSYGNSRQRLKAGQFVYYPSGFHHTLQAVGDSPADYLMFKWHAPVKKNGDGLEYGLFDMYEPIAGGSSREGFCYREIFRGPTAILGKLQCHISQLAPGAGYEPHIDPYDVAIIVLEGEVETLGKRVGPHGVIFYAAGEPHGMRNSGSSTARYIVFEFHGRQSLFHKRLHRVVRRARSTVKKGADVFRR